MDESHSVLTVEGAVQGERFDNRLQKNMKQSEVRGAMYGSDRGAERGTRAGPRKRQDCEMDTRKLEGSGIPSRMPLMMSREHCNERLARR